MLAIPFNTRSSRMSWFVARKRLNRRLSPPVRMTMYSVKPALFASSEISRSTAPAVPRITPVRMLEGVDFGWTERSGHVSRLSDAPGRRVSALCHDGAIVDHLAADLPYRHGVQERNDVRA